MVKEILTEVISIVKQSSQYAISPDVNRLKKVEIVFDIFLNYDYRKYINAQKEDQ